MRVTRTVVLTALVVMSIPIGVGAQTLGEVFRKVTPSVVVIRATGREVSAGGQKQFAETGSGVLISTDGKVMTAAHVVHTMDEITVEFLGGESVAVNMGALPAAGGWSRIEIPLSQLTLEQTAVTRIDITYVDGQVWFDHFGKTGTACIPATAPAPTIPNGDTVWVDDGLPAGASLVNGANGPMHWDSAQAAGGTQSLANW